MNPLKISGPGPSNNVKDSHSFAAKYQRQHIRTFSISTSPHHGRSSGNLGSYRRLLMNKIIERAHIRNYHRRQVHLTFSCRPASKKRPLTSPTASSTIMCTIESSIHLHKERAKKRSPPPSLNHAIHVPGPVQRRSTKSSKSVPPAFPFSNPKVSTKSIPRKSQDSRSIKRSARQ